MQKVVDNNLLFLLIFMVFYESTTPQAVLRGLKGKNK